ncbi:hypothetical protein GEMRC1_005766 [Eukaryota sp. GEM-RC1]
MDKTVPEQSLDANALFIFISIYVLDVFFKMHILDDQRSRGHVILLENEVVFDDENGVTIYNCDKLEDELQVLVLDEYHVVTHLSNNEEYPNLLDVFGGISTCRMLRLKQCVGKAFFSIPNRGQTK